MITTRTSDRLAVLALQIQAISTAVYEAGFRSECRELELAAHRIAMASYAIEQKIEAGARSMLRDDPADTLASDEGR